MLEGCKICLTIIPLRACSPSHPRVKRTAEQGYGVQICKQKLADRENRSILISIVEASGSQVWWSTRRRIFGLGHQKQDRATHLKREEKSKNQPSVNSNEQRLQVNNYFKNIWEKKVFFGHRIQRFLFKWRKRKSNKPITITSANGGPSVRREKRDRLVQKCRGISQKHSKALNELKHRIIVSTHSKTQSCCVGTEALSLTPWPPHASTTLKRYSISSPPTSKQ